VLYLILTKRLFGARGGKRAYEERLRSESVFDSATRAAASLAPATAAAAGSATAADPRSAAETAPRRVAGATPEPVAPAVPVRPNDPTMPMSPPPDL
jgi:hypothetical protein